MPNLNHLSWVLNRPLFIREEDSTAAAALGEQLKRKTLNLKYT